LGKIVDEGILFDLAKNLLAQIVVDGRAWPCLNLSLSVGGWEDGMQGNKGIGSFLLRGEEAKMVLDEQRSATGRRSNPDVDAGPPQKKRRSGNTAIDKFLVRGDNGETRSGHDDDDELHAPAYPGDDLYDRDPHQEVVDDFKSRATERSYSTMPPISGQQRDDSPPPSTQPPSLHPSSPPDPNTYLCAKCHTRLPVDERQEHEDWHYAKDLEEQFREAETIHNTTAQEPAVIIPNLQTTKQQSTAIPTVKRGRGRPPGSHNISRGRGGASEKGQKKLAFG
jgi:DNA polymerase eta